MVRGKKVRIALIQMSMQSEKGKNLKKASFMVEKAAKDGAKVVCLPELFLTNYFPQKENADFFSLAETIPGKTTKHFSALAKKLKVVILVPLYEVTKDSHYYNSVAVIDENGNILDTYRKIHMPHDPLFYEKDYFEEGDTGFKVVKTSFGNIAPLICFDQWFPEAARVLALKGADIIFYPTAIGSIRGKKSNDDWKDAWITIQRSHAIANNVYVAPVNRVGVEGDLEFFGSSFVADPFGKIISKAKNSGDEIVYADVDFSENERLRHDWGFFAKRRAHEYSLIINDSIRDLPKGTPFSLGYSFPAEWKNHSAVLLAWPYDRTSFPELDPVEKTYVEIIKSLNGGENVLLLVRDPEMKKSVLSIFSKNRVSLSNVKILEFDYGDVWFRDFGPTYVVNEKEKKIGMVKWSYNAYGEKYDELLKDDLVPAFLNKYSNLPYFDSGIVMEGGSIETNGNGVLITTEECLLNKNRNPDLQKKDIEQKLKDYLGVEKIIWLKNGLINDDTDGHIDNLARFVNEKTILCAYEDNEKDINYNALDKNYRILSSLKKFGVVKLPMPHFTVGKKRISASYANFYIGNKVVLVPQFGDKNDRIAIKIISKYFKGKKIIGIDCRKLVIGGGTLHCITQQVPDV